MATKETVSHKAKELVFRVDPEPAGTMIMSFKLTIGKIARLGVAAYHNEAIISITPWVRELDPFLFLVLPERARRGATKGAIKGATLNRDSLDGLLVPLPPLAEQHRIVAKVEELMALCDQSEAAQREREARRDGLRSASLQRLTASNGDAKRGAADAQFFLDLSQRLITKPQHVADLRQTILELAVRGRLVPQDSQDETAAELLGARVMRDDRAAELWTLPAGWEWSCLAKLGEQIGGGTPSKSNPNFWIGSTPWVSPKDMKVDLILDAIDHVSTDAIAASTTKLIPVPALLMVVRGMILSHSFPSALSGVPLTMNQDMKALIPFRADLAPMLLLLVKAMKEHVLALVQHSTHGTCRLNTADLFGLLLPIPPLAEQHRIVAKVDELMRVCDELEASLAYAWDGRVRLLEALLHEALGDAALPNAVGGGTAV
jgi:type I restriction enzyme S subunit